MNHLSWLATRSLGTTGSENKMTVAQTPLKGRHPIPQSHSNNCTRIGVKMEMGLENTTQGEPQVVVYTDRPSPKNSGANEMLGGYC